jgi:post-segregation antitoxin (ccd killing protein)
LNSDLYARAKAHGINVSRVAETALTEALAARIAGEIRADIEKDLAAYNVYSGKHGSPAEMLRDYLADREGES